MKTIDTLAYDATTDRFNAGFCEKTADDIFMSMDELCSQEKQQKEVLVKTAQAMPKSDAMDRLIKELLGDRLLELSRYVMLDTLNRSMTIDKTALIDAKKDGLNEGKQLGLSEGKQIRNIEIAKNLMKKNVDIDTISESTGLTIAEINKLKDETTL